MKTTLLSAFILASTFLMPPAFAAPATNAAETTRIENIVHQYLVKNPEVLVEAMQALQRKQYEQAERTVKETQANVAKYANDLLRHPNDPIAGNPNGKITVVEFFDYQCPHCVDMAPVVKAVIKSNPDVKFVFKEFPIRGPQSELFARAALAAHKQGKYTEFQHAALTATKPLNEALIIEIAKSQGLDADKLKKDMQDNAIKVQLEANAQLAKELKLFGTPALFVGKSDAKNADQINYVPGQVTEKQLDELINKAK